MEEANALATRAAIMSKRLLAIGSIRGLRRKYSNEYHVHLILKTAPLSTAEEMQEVAAWASKVFKGARSEGKNLGGQIRFIIPAEESTSSRLEVEEGQTCEVSPVEKSSSTFGDLIETLERHKEELGIDFYSVGAATMERVFMSVVRENQVAEEDDGKKARWWN